MIDINELRRLAQAATPGPDGVSLNWLKLLQDFQKEANPAVINELLDRLEAAESDALEQARLNGMGASREASLMAKLEAAEKEVAHIKEVEFPRKMRAVAAGWETKCARLEQERDELLARIEERERQEPVGTLHDDGCFVWSTPRPYESNYAGWKMKLYLAPGAQPAPKKGAALAYTDPEASADENSLHIVSSLMAGRAYNSICKMIGGRWPDAKIQEEAPEAHDFFMAMFTGSPEESAVHPALPNRGDGAAGAGCPV